MIGNRLGARQRIAPRQRQQRHVHGHAEFEVLSVIEITISCAFGHVSRFGILRKLGTLSEPMGRPRRSLVI